MSAPTPSVVQVALCSSDVPRSVALLQALGFQDAGGRVFSGASLAEIQALGDDAAAVVWWLVGRDEFLQIELFAHTEPAQRPLPADHRPCDIGWTRWAIEVTDLDAALAAVATFGVTPLTAPQTDTDGRRVCFREPWTGVVVELFEPPLNAFGAAGSPDENEKRPSVHSVTVSVPDLDRAHEIYVDVLGMPEVAPLHRAEHEALWGLPDASAAGFTVRNGAAAIEVVAYSDPVPQPLPDDYRLSDQGLMHAAVGCRDTATLRVLAGRATDAGLQLTVPPPTAASGGTYAFDRDGLSIELFAAPAELDDLYGFVPVPPPPFG